MRVVMFYQSLISDWNHGNAHFLRGIASELLVHGHHVEIFEPEESWSVANLLAEYGEPKLNEFRVAYPQLSSHRFDLNKIDFDEILHDADLVIVHEWNDPELIRDIGIHRRLLNFKLLFHDTHHRLATQHSKRLPFDLKDYDGVLAYGKVIRDLYLREGWAQYAWIWHEAADVRVFHPMPEIERTADLVWIGNWGDDERTNELQEFLISPVKRLQLMSSVFGVRYPAEAKAALAAAGIDYCGWLPNFRVPEVFARFRVTVHIPRRPYATLLPGIPTIRPFEALACGIPLVCSPWVDTEGLFKPHDFLIAKSGPHMEKLISQVLNDPAMAQELALNGLSTILERHTCSHRVDELLRIYSEIASPAERPLAIV
ncbi:MAG: glycosyltransferase [Pyrinomonadaceae bacterium]